MNEKKPVGLKIGNTTFNVDVCKKMTKTEFLKNHKNLGKHIDLEDAYNRIKGK